MPAHSDCQLLIDPPAEGAWNMAVDEALLTAAAESGLPTLRFYQWQRPTLSLGYFQSYAALLQSSVFQNDAERDTHTASRDIDGNIDSGIDSNIDVVRRLSGGGAIVHDHELTYSLFLPATHRLAQDTQALYDAVHAAIIETLTDFLKSTSLGSTGYQAASCQKTLGLAARDEPFLCFERRSLGDILLLRKEAKKSPKIVGSAQRRRRGVVMQHGSLLLQQSTATPQLPGIAEISKVKISPDELCQRLTHAFSQKLRLNLQASKLSEQLTASARQLQSTKYAANDWTRRR